MQIIRPKATTKIANIFGAFIVLPFPNLPLREQGTVNSLHGAHNVQKDMLVKFCRFEKNTL
jgi:hypothetical protein